MCWVLAWATLALAAVYAGALAILWHAWHALPPLYPDEWELPFVSVLIPARNEEAAIVPCLQALLQQTYPPDRYEVLVIDDHSEDHTAALVSALPTQRIRLLSLADHLAGKQVVAYKKAALSWGVAEARGTLILTTDADCIAPPNWVAGMVAAYQSGADFITAPVCIYDDGSLLSVFQALDVAGTMILTGGAVGLGHPILANGANLGFSRALFERVGGYAGHTHLASGDDVLLLQKVVNGRAGRVVFLPSPEVSVSTAPTPNWAALGRQRLRWAAKTSAYRNFYLLGFQGAVFVLSWCIVLSFICAPELALGALGIKALADFFYLRAASRWFGHPRWMRWFVLSELLHLLYLVIIGSVALWPVRIQWKGRRAR